MLAVFVRGFLDTRSMRVMADFWFRRGSRLHEICFGTVLDAVKFHVPVDNDALPNRWSNVYSEFREYIFDFALQTQFCTTMSAIDGCEEVLFEQVLEKWIKDHDARFLYDKSVRLKDSGGVHWTQKTCIVLHLPLMVMELVLGKAWNCIAMKILLNKKYSTMMNLLGSKLQEKCKAMSAAQMPDDLNPEQFVMLNARLFEAAGNIIRNRPMAGEWSCEEIIANTAQVDVAYVLQWLDSMQDYIDSGQLQHLRKTARVVSSTTAFRIESLILSVKVSGLLRSAKKMKENIAYVSELLGFSKDWMDASRSMVASKTTVQRHMFTLDAALAKSVTNRLHQHFHEEGVVCALLTDSSPRKGREWLFTEAFIIQKNQLMTFLEKVNDLWRQGTLMNEQRRMRRDRPAIEHAQEEEKEKDDFVEFMQSRAIDRDQMRCSSLEMQQLVWHHIFVPATLGAKNLTAAAKFAAVLHQLRLESFDWNQVSQLLRLYVNVCMHVCMHLYAYMCVYVCNVCMHACM